jgi:hypothetical protein
MIQVLLLAAMLANGTPADTFDIQAELQGLYDEISQATLQFMTTTDIDQFHAVIYTPDWVFIDTAGHKKTWSEIRPEVVQGMLARRPESMTQPIKTLAVDHGVATVVVNVVTVRIIVDREGRYGRADGTHTVTDTTPFRDKWVKVSDEWKLKSREQIGPPSQLVDKPY